MLRYDPHLSNSTCNIPLDLEFLHLKMISLLRSWTIGLRLLAIVVKHQRLLAIVALICSQMHPLFEIHVRALA
jgi:hypothetical protein